MDGLDRRLNEIHCIVVQKAFQGGSWHLLIAYEIDWDTDRMIFEIFHMEHSFSRVFVNRSNN